MVRRYLGIFIALATFCFSYGCWMIEYMDFKLIVYNNSDDAIIYSLRFDTSIAAKDISWYTANDHPVYDELLAHDSLRPPFVRRGDGWENTINTNSKDSRLRIFFFKVYSVKHYGWDKVLRLKTYKRLDIRANALESLHWRIIYK